MAAKPRIGFFITCIADLMRPQTAQATLELIRQAGFEPVIPQSQTCCGQPALNSGRRDGCKALARKLAVEFEHCDIVVAPSGSCIGALTTHVPELYAEDEPGAQEIAAFAAKCQELSQFLISHSFQPKKSAQPLKIAYHDSCAGLRELGIKDGPRQLLQQAGHELVPLQDADVCCGFGGTFAVNFGEVSGKMADEKCGRALDSSADVLAMGDLGCVLNIEGRMGRRGEAMPVRHYAELLAGTPL